MDCSRLTGHVWAPVNEHGDLLDGFLTAFVNVSRVQPIASIDEYAEALDDWLFVVSQLGFHARHMEFHGCVEVWQRRQVAGVTLMFKHLDLTIGDLVLLWNTQHPDRMAVDLGTGLERLAWARTRLDWSELVYGPFANAVPASVLDAVRTATLILGSGITPSARGAGGVLRRVIAAIPPDLVRLGASAIVRAFHQQWAESANVLVPWPVICGALEEEVAKCSIRRPPPRRRVAPSTSKTMPQEFLSPSDPTRVGSGRSLSVAAPGVGSAQLRPDTT
ncbi:hypothetical protein LHJ74_07795 [Streptomyces sp. N2-109]|uniref:Uncharacterized protein n=1 Tax=Streptomyces gossypii TaxID=2883101 RepID=A0ABT2JPL1_9ACTN|nr:hypothetical protein [Streptomyces gossypii]MCT2589817.1 hypothetical protein [Streptomyces gossypii]